MHAVVELPGFIRGAEMCGLFRAENVAIFYTVSANPEAGSVIVGTGGCRKLRVAGRGKGKSGGYRTNYFFSGASIPVFLLAIYGKDEKDNLSHLERTQMAAKQSNLLPPISGRKN